MVTVGEDNSLWDIKFTQRSQAYNKKVGSAFHEATHPGGTLEGWAQASWAEVEHARRRNLA